MHRWSFLAAAEDASARPKLTVLNTGAPGFRSRSESSPSSASSATRRSACVRIGRLNLPVSRSLPKNVFPSCLATVRARERGVAFVRSAPAASADDANVSMMIAMSLSVNWIPGNGPGTSGGGSPGGGGGGIGAPSSASTKGISSAPP